MSRTLTITYFDKSNKGLPVMCVSEDNLFSPTVINMFTGEKAETLYKDLTESDQYRHTAWLLHQVIDRKGKDHQIDIAIEEMSELTKALLKDRRHHSPETVTDIIEEMADVAICLEELYIIFENRSEVEDMIDRKLQRLKKRLKEDEKGKENGNGSGYTVTAPQGGQAR